IVAELRALESHASHRIRPRPVPKVGRHGAIHRSINELERSVPPEDSKHVYGRFGRFLSDTDTAPFGSCSRRSPTRPVTTGPALQ
ncbi:hypothetical protein ACFL59_10890, partial [Planctomycetota bacterium]